MAAHFANNHADVWSLYRAYWAKGKWEPPDHRVPPGRHRRAPHARRGVSTLVRLLAVLVVLAVPVVVAVWVRVFA